MARSAIPNFGIEYPAWVETPWPRHVGYDAQGEVLTAKDQEEYDNLKPLAVLPKLMGKDKNGKDVIAQTPRDLEWLKASVVTPPEDPAVVKKREEDRLAAIAETERKAKAYDEMMAAQDAKTPADQNALTQAAKPAKSKAA